MIYDKLSHNVRRNNATACKNYARSTGWLSSHVYLYYDYQIVKKVYACNNVEKKALFMTQ